MKRSTKTTDPRTTEKLAAEYERAATSRRTAAQARRVISDLHRDLTGEEMPTATVRAFAEKWLARKKPEVTDSTFRYYDGQTRRFLEWLGPRADEDMAAISRGL